jgi:DNA repair protein RecN (Recombination protein N)
MLRNLSLRDFVIVDLLDLDVQPGFTVLTGETGAGKSILVDALSLLLGARADAPVVRNGAGKAEIAAEFDLAGLPAAREWIERNDLSDEGGCLMRRVIEDSGRSRAFINGSPVTLAQMRELGGMLIDIHGQHEHQKLAGREAQRELLDGFAGAESRLKEVAEAFRAWQELRALRVAREANEAASSKEREELGWQIGELEGLGFSVVEWDAMQSEHNRLAHAAALIATAQTSLDSLDETESSALAQVDSVAAQLARGAQIDIALKPAAEMVESASVGLREAVHLLRQYRDRLELDPQRLDNLERRIAAIFDMARKHRTEPARLPELLQQKQQRLEALGGMGSLEALRAGEQGAEARYREAAVKLSKQRAQAARKFAAAVSESMQTLAMQGGRFTVELAACEPAAYGLEQCEFMVAAHEGQPLGALSKTASGGELSRISLAIQVLASTRAGVATLIFDEVDAGIGGRVAEITGRLLAQLATRHQVFCVTHLAQVAACANRQLRVTKETHQGKVVSRTALLAGSARVEEIARMLGGITITPATLKHAEEMLRITSGEKNIASC